MNLMSRKCLLNQATCSPKTFDDVQMMAGAAALGCVTISMGCKKTMR
jgi:hypothetical protein